MSQSNPEYKFSESCVQISCPSCYTRVCFKVVSFLTHSLIHLCFHEDHLGQLWEEETKNSRPDWHSLISQRWIAVEESRLMCDETRHPSRIRAMVHFRANASNLFLSDATSADDCLPVESSDVFQLAKCWCSARLAFFCTLFCEYAAVMPWANIRAHEQITR